MTPKRKKIEELVENTFSRLDPTGINAKKYKTMFQTMTDDQFAKWFEAFKKDDKSNFRWDIEEFGDGSRSVKFDNVEKAADFLNVKLFEYVYTPHTSSDPNRPTRSKQPVLVGELNIKRPQQLVTKKTGLSLSDTDRNDMTGEARGDSKGGTTTGIETELLIGVGGEDILSEIIGARGDNIVEYDNMLSQISEKGSVKLSDIKTNVYDKPTLLKADIFFKMMGLKTDIVSPAYYSIAKYKSNMENN